MLLKSAMVLAVVLLSATAVLATPLATAVAPLVLVFNSVVVDCSGVNGEAFAS